MTAKVPIRAVFDGSTATGLAEYQSGEYIDLTYGGLGVSLSLGTANQVLRVNSSANAVEFGSIVSTGALDSGSITSGFGAIDNGTSNIRSATITAETAFVPDAADGASLGTSSLEFSDLFLADGGTITLGNGQDVTITHVADTGIEIKNVSTSGNSGVGAVLSLQTGDTDIAVNNVLGQIDFQAPDEGSASDAVLVAASIAAVSEGDFSASNNATKLSFKTGASEVATEKMSLSSGGNLTVSGTIAGTLATAAQTNITSLGTLTALQIDNININGNAISSTAGTDLTITPVSGQQIVLDGTIVVDAGVVTGATSITSTAFVGDITGDVTGNADTATALATARTIGGTSFDGSANIAVGLAAEATALATARTIGGTSFDGSANIAVALAALATTATVTDSTANTNFPVVFNNESSGLLDDTGALRYNPSTGTLLVPNLVVAGTTSTVDTVTMEAENAIIFEGATADDHETTLTIIDPTADRTINLPNQSGTIPVLAAASNTAITSTPAELNKLDGATVVVGEINALDLGSTAVGTAIASKAVILDSSKDYTGIQNLTISGEIDAATGDYSGAVDIAGATTTAAITASGIIKTDDSTAATSTTDGSLQTDGGLSVVLDAVIGDDLFLLSDAAVLSFGANSEVTLTHVHNDGLLLNTDMQLQFRDSAINIRSDDDGDLDINADDEIELNSTLIDINGNVQISGTLAQADAITIATNKKIIFRDAAIHISSTDDGDLAIAADDEIDITSTLIDINGNLDVSGTYTGGGVMTTGGNIVIPDAGTIGSASDTGAISIAADGTVDLDTAGATVASVAIKTAGKESIWIPSGAMYPSTTNGCAAIAQVETVALRPDLKVLDFATGADEFAQFSIAFPKSWNEGTVTFQPYWTVTGTNTGTVAWQLAACSVSSDGNLSLQFGTRIATTALAHSGTSNDLMVSVESGALTIAGSPAVDDQCFFQINRDTSADAQSGDARLLGLKLFFTTDVANDA